MNIVIIFLSSLVLSLLFGYIFVPILTEKNIRQIVSNFVNVRHQKKNGTPTMGGLIFLSSFLLTIILMLVFKKISLNINLILIIISVVLYGFLGFIDDYQKIKLHNNAGLSIKNKFILEIVFSLIIYFIYKIYINNNQIIIFNWILDIKFLYGIFIFLFITTMTNAVNITDGLDGLATTISIINFFTMGLILYNSHYNIAIICFVISASLLGFLYFNIYPAKIFMGDLGSLSLGALLAIIGILTKKEIIIIIISLCYLFELLSSFLQIVGIKLFSKKIFLKAPFHHHLEQKNYDEIAIVKLFFYTNIIINLIVLIIEYYL